jgi:ketosteroid isomerase-like protein
MAESQNMALAREWAAAFNRWDIDALVALSHPDFELHEWPDAPGARSYQGQNAIRHGIATWFESWEWMKVEVQDMREAGDRLLVMLHQRAAGKGSAVEVEIDTYNVMQFRDGQLAELHMFTAEEPALEVFRG